ncbi:MAG: LacI family transcriptional regulator [Actinomycetota bacterium]|nr:LacI family transcriptional regulator [Actinomycetota bacterium]
MAGSEQVTIETVARLAGVSRQTVSNALNAPQRLRPGTLTTVLAAIRELGYQPNRAARSLRSRESRLVGLQVGPAPVGAAGSLLDRFLHSLVEASVGAGYHLLLFTPPVAEDELSGFSELLTSTSVDAFVLTDTHRGDRRLPWLTRRRAPFVTFGRSWEPTDTHSWVDVDGAAGTRLAVQHLVAQGHRRIAFIGWPAGSDVGEDRRSGWLGACSEAGLPTDGLTAHCDDDATAAGACALTLLDADPRPTALVCASDTLAFGALSALVSRGLRAGHDVAVTGFDDTSAAALVPGHGLTSVRQPVEDVARAIVARLVGLLGGHPQADGPGELLLPELVVRQTTQPRWRTTP